MAGQEHKSPQRRDADPDGDAPEPAAPAAQAGKQELDEDTDSMLAEIDGVLESNAEEFVRGFVQKGGQ
ncbi:ubiquitin-like protein Pup [Allobranchiibius sp. GilTou38]|uniref:ubiquitin-like protein Pup n=1 Tax=Allobranchiibius sp. GilTou38 TaxID=2815210 RepID=UPI001AA11B17|nr:ubiquitin-like protein Pup [Allobranchiibius sp. GilTou38]MBO1766412.1 ubiquitin-like protein Pup [Allobranchiibius sp. GilTou38]